MSQDPVFWEVGQTREGKMALMNPQAQNSYSYAGDNPINGKDPGGRWYKEFLWDNITTLGNGQSRSSFQMEVGLATQELTNSSPAWSFAVDHPIESGAIVAAGSIPALEAGSSAGIIIGTGVLAKGVSSRFVATKAAGAGIYAYLAADQITGTIPSVLGAAGNIANKGMSAKNIGSLAWNTATSFVPGFIGKMGKLGETFGATLDVSILSGSTVYKVAPKSSNSEKDN